MRQTDEVCADPTAPLQCLLASSDVALAGEDSDGRIICWSRGASRLLNYSPASILGSCLPVHAPTAGATIAGARAQVLDGGLATLRDIAFEREDGHCVAIDLLATPLPIHARGHGVLWTMTGSQHASEDRLRDGAAASPQLADLIEAMPIPVFVKDVQGRYQAFNRAWEVFFGRHREEWIGRTVAEKFPLDAARAYQDQDEQLLRTGGVLEWEDELRSFRGEATPVIYRKTALRDADGRVAGIAGTILDVTKLRLAEARFQQVVEMTPGALVVCDRQGRILLVNAQTEALFGYDRADLLDMSIEQLLPERHRGAHAAYRDAYAGAAVGRPMGQGRELHARRQDGSELPVEVALGPLHSDEGERVIAVVADISARVAAQSQIEANLREKTTLLDEIHHRVKNNLQIIGSLLSLQAASSRDDPVRLALRDAIGRVRSIGLMHELLYEHSDLSTIDLGTYLGRLIRLVRGASGADNERVAFDLDLDPIAVDMGQAIHCGLIANELLTNALKHGFPEPARGRIQVSLKATDADRIVFAVSDDGRGYESIPDAEGSDTLGLRLVGLLTDQIGGGLRVTHHAAPGQSVRFELTFSPHGRKKGHDRR